MKSAGIEQYKILEVFRIFLLLLRRSKGRDLGRPATGWAGLLWKPAGWIKKERKIKMNTHWRALEFDKIIEQLQEVSVSEQVKERFQDLAPYPKEDTCIRAMAETTQARRILDACGTPPLPLMKGMEELLIQSEAGGCCCRSS